MNTESKKALADKVMGWGITHDDWFITKKDRPESEINLNVYNWNPHTNDTQFIEVLRKLTTEQMSFVEQKIEEHAHSEGCFLMESFIIEDSIWLFDNKPEVLKAILGVIK